MLPVGEHPVGEVIFGGVIGELLATRYRTGDLGFHHLVAHTPIDGVRGPATRRFSGRHTGQSYRDISGNGGRDRSGIRRRVWRDSRNLSGPTHRTAFFEQSTGEFLPAIAKLVGGRGEDLKCQSTKCFKGKFAYLRPADSGVCFSRSRHRSSEYRSAVSCLFTAKYRAFLEPTTTTSFLPRVIPV